MGEERFWNLSAGLYDRFMGRDAGAYRRMFGLMRSGLVGRDVLEVATGTGLVAGNVASFARHVEAIDRSPRMIAVARKRNSFANVRFSVQDACRLDYDEASFDVAIICNALHVMPDPHTVLEACRRVLVPKGRLIVPTYVHADTTGSVSFRSRLMQRAGFPLYHAWTGDAYLQFLTQQGWSIRYAELLQASLPLLYVECLAI